MPWWFGHKLTFDLLAISHLRSFEPRIVWNLGRYKLLIALVAEQHAPAPWVPIAPCALRSLQLASVGAFFTMSSSESSLIPSWDGIAKSWRRYVCELVWCVQSTKVPQRRLLATKLTARLTGSARLLAMSWPQAEFDSWCDLVSPEGG